MLGVATFILGGCFLFLTIAEIYYGKINISSKVGSGEITVSREPYFFWLLIGIEVFAGLTAISGGLLIILKKLPVKWKD